MIDIRPKVGMILAAGFGKRLESVLKGVPKPLVELVPGLAMLNIAINSFFRIPHLEKIIVNTHYKSEQIKQSLAKYIDHKKPILISEEKEILETGGGIMKAMDEFGRGTYLIRNSDTIFFDNGDSIFDNLFNVWNSEKMDALLLLIPKNRTSRYLGDFSLGKDNRIIRNNEENNLVYTGVSIISPRFFETKKISKFSITEILCDYTSRPLISNRCFGIIVSETTSWYDIGTPDQLSEARDFVARNGISSIQ